MNTIKKTDITKFIKKYQNKIENKVIENAISKNGIENATFNNDVNRFHNYEFSIQTTKAGMTNQKASGRCWIFAALNVIKTDILKELNVENFEFSQNYLSFWDKLEKANTFLELMIEHNELDYNDRLITSFVDFASEDGGYFEWAADLINKYGVVPKSIMNETFTSENTDTLNQIIKGHLFSTIKRFKQAFSENKSLEEIRKIKLDSLNVVFDMCVKAFGMPIEKFDYEYRDKDKKFHKLSNMTPLKFLNKFVKKDLKEMVNIGHDPRPEHNFNTLIKTKYFKSVVEGKTFEFINTDINDIKEAIIDSLKANEPVWFGCDVGKFSDRNKGIMDTEIFNFTDSLKNYDELSKADRINFRYSAATHAMTFVGVDLDENNKPIKWEVENSWGEKNGQKGYFSMSDKWFDEYVFEVIVNQKYIKSSILKEASEKESIVLEPWDPLA
ncbi:C1 family peptidase [Mycoplasmopsis lipofaciens]|uniref:C1 family peptidase n=1 Tax=Mycoplasmopsis lipofaciens TaxID=114884 RepID=UPI00069030C5|nr:C1 family peptidase [Mycoplasmopsis lipofaciens]